MKNGQLFTVSVALIVAVGGFLLGFDATVISGAVPFIKNYFALTGTGGDLKLGWAVSCLGWGALGGNAAAGFLSDAFGRKKVLMLTALFFTVSALHRKSPWHQILKEIHRPPQSTPQRQ